MHMTAIGTVGAGGTVVVEGMDQEVRLFGRVDMRDHIDLAVGHETRHEDVTPQGDPPEHQVPDALDTFAEATGQYEEDEEQAHAGEQQLVLREGEAQDLNESDTHQHAADGVETSDDGHG